MKTRVLRVIQVFFKSAALKFVNVLSKLSRTILKLKLQIQNGMNKSGNKQENPLQEETEEISRRIGESKADPQPPEPPTPLRAREIEESTVNPQPIQLPNSIGVRKKDEFKITPPPPPPKRRGRVP